MQDEDYSPQPEQGVRPRISPQISDKLSAYGPIALGALIVILLIVGVFSFLRNRATQTPSLRNTGFAQVSPSPSPTPSASPTTKGGVTKLPETGFPLLPLAAASLGIVGAGIYLRKR